MDNSFRYPPSSRGDNNNLEKFTTKSLTNNEGYTYVSNKTHDVALQYPRSPNYVPKNHKSFNKVFYRQQKLEKSIMCNKNGSFSTYEFENSSNSSIIFNLLKQKQTEIDKNKKQIRLKVLSRPQNRSNLNKKVCNQETRNNFHASVGRNSKRILKQKPIQPRSIKNSILLASLINSEINVNLNKPFLNSSNYKSLIKPTHVNISSTESRQRNKQIKAKVDPHVRITENNIPGARFYVTKLQETDGDYMAVELAIKASVRAPFRSCETTVFRVNDMYEIPNSRHHRLLFHGTGVKEVIGILQSGFRTDVEKRNGRRFGNGIYLSPHCSTARKFCRFSSKIEYVVVVEVTVSDDSFIENPEKNNLPFSVYRSKYSIDSSFDIVDSNQKIISTQFIKNKVNCHTTGSGLDEYVVRNQEFLIPRYLIKFKIKN